MNLPAKGFPPSIPVTSAAALLMICEKPRLLNEIPPIIFNRLMRAGYVETYSAEVEGLGIKRLHVRATGEGHAASLLKDRVDKPAPGDDAEAVATVPAKYGRLPGL